MKSPSPFEMLVAALGVVSTPALAVGLGPLTKEGIIDGPREAFYLTLYNPYSEALGFKAYAVGADDEHPQDRVTIIPAHSVLGKQQARRIIVIAGGLEVDKPYVSRVCAEREVLPEGALINARVCSKLTARRVR